jgi:hypothetical protein
MKSISFILTVALSTMLTHQLTAQDMSQDVSGKTIAQFEESKESKFATNIQADPSEIFKEIELKKHHHSDKSKKNGFTTKSYAQFYTEENAIVPAGQPIPFTSTSVASSKITLLPGGRIQIDQKGDYLVTFGAAIGGSFNRIALRVGLNIALGTNVTLNVGSLTIATILHVTSVPTILSVVNNNTVAPFTLSTAVPQDLTAFISIFRLHKLPTP